MTCRCNHQENDHKDGICNGSIDCLCTSYEKVVQTKIHPNFATPSQFGGAVWDGRGWKYKKSFGATQKDMIKKYLEMGKNVDEIQQLLRCKRSSIRGRKSELRSAGLISSNY